jgi:hypothetical protein
VGTESTVIVLLRERGGDRERESDGLREGGRWRTGEGGRIAWIEGE